MLLRGKRLMEELLSTLTKVKSLRVSARTLAFAFKDKKEDIRKIGQLLNVDHVVQRSVRKAGNTLRITVQLMKVSDGFHRWSQAYGRAMKMHAILQIQSDVAQRVASAPCLRRTPQRIVETMQLRRIILSGT